MNIMRKVWFVAALTCGLGLARQDGMEEAARFAAAKFDGVAAPRPARAHMTVRLTSGAIERNRRKGVVMRIGGRPYDGGIVMPSPGEIVVHLAAPGRMFEAVVGVDSNDLGYYSNGGRGSVVLTVEANGRELFRSPVLKEGMAGVPVRVGLAGASEFALRLAHEGGRGPTYQSEWDMLDLADARVELESGALRLADVSLGPPERDWSTEAPFSFVYDGRPSATLLKEWTLKRGRRSLDGHRTEHTASWTDPATGLAVRMVGVAYDDSPAVEWTVYLKNGGTAATPIIESLQGIDAAFDRTPEGEFLLHHSKGSPNSATDFQPLETRLAAKSELKIASEGGRGTDGNLCYFNLAWAGRGVILGLGWPGQWSALFQRDAERGVRIVAGQELTHFRLAPGEEVRTPLVALVFWSGDWIAGQNLWRRWMIEHNLPRPGGKLPPPQLSGGSNRHTIEMQEATEENQKHYLAQTLAAGLPIDYWWMDAGWYIYKDGWWKTGTWQPDPKRFPNGFTPISAAAHAKNVKTIVWFEPERVAEGSWLAEQHPEWLLGQKGKDRLLFLGNPEARRWLVDHVSRMIAEQGIDTYRQDFNFAPLAIWRGADAPDRQGITEIQHVMGYLAYWDELRRRFPKLLIDTCASGGRRDDLETLRRSAPLWRSDYAFEPTSMQGQTYGMSLWIPYFGTAVNSVDPYYFWSQVTPAVGLGLDPARIEAGYQKLGALLAEWRAVSGYYYGDFYPLTAYSLEPTSWMGWQFHSPDGQAGMVQAFRRPDSPYESARFALRGLDPAARYLVRSGDHEVEVDGKSLGEGLRVSIGQRPGAVVVTYRRIR